ncbi:MAG: hemerythrin domain-containing protein [Calditrichota bacterium]
MSDPINTLMNEHQVIKNVLEALAGYAERLERHGDADRAELLKFTDFFAHYADQLHHGKEEDILFAEMANHGFSPQYGPVAVMLAEHEHGRRCVGVLRVAGEQAGQPWTSDEARHVVDTAREYIVLLGSHIDKEDNILYPMAQSHIPYTVMQNMATTFDRMAQGEPAAAEKRLLTLADELSAVYSNV